MRFATLIDKDGGERFGLVTGETVLLAPKAGLDDCVDLRSAIKIGLSAVADRLRDVGEVLALAEATYAPVIPNPSQIYCVGLNYKKHRDETRQSERRQYPKYPVIFSRFATSLTGHSTPLVKPSVSDVVDFEGELAVVIGKPAHHVSREEAADHIAGYSVFNDISMRDWQIQGEQWTPGKNFLGSGPFGPWLVTPDEVGELDDLYLRTWLDGKIMQEARFADLIHDIPGVMSYISDFTCLYPGDVIAMGTPGGVGFTRNPQELLLPGRKIVVEIDRIGRLENTVVAEA